MAGLLSLKILLFWAGIISLTNCQSLVPTTEQPPTSIAPTTLSASKNRDSQSNPSQNPDQNATKATTEAPPPPQCSFTVTPVKFGFQINISSSTAGTFVVFFREEVQPEIGRKTTVDGSKRISWRTIDHLKPCTEYEYEAVFVNAGGKTRCNVTENKTRTITMDESEIASVACMPGYVCYRSDWDIGASLSASNNIQAEPCISDNKTYCIKPGHNDICTDLNITFTSGNCSSFNLTKRVSLDILNPSEINQSIPTELPATIVPVLPPNCKDLTFTYTCLRELGKPNEAVNLSNVEPFTDYRCVGDIKDNNVTLIKTTPIPVRVDCNLKITAEGEATNTSIDLTWTTDSDNCKDVLPKLPNLSYRCACASSHTLKGSARVDKQSLGGTCSIPGLEPYTDYKCKVQPTYNDENVGQPVEVKEMTNVGVPDQTPKVKVSYPKHNVIRAVCVHIKHFNGPSEKYVARLVTGSGTLKKTETKKTCDFQFKDLSYSTAYMVKVTTSNGIFESMPITEKAATLYNDKALIGFLVFLIILTSVALLFVVYRIYILKRRKSHDMNEDMMLISPATDECLLPVEPIASELLLETYKRKLADEGRLFLDEFQSIPRIFLRFGMKEAKKACNVPKNRYVDILPYDYNRVQLTTGNGEAGCDYINASFIDGYKESKKYIAAQGPKEETVSDFWRMIWEQQSSIIVMVTRCEEGNRAKCVQYWPAPEREAEIFEEFIVRLKSEDHCPDYTVRHLSLTNKRERNSEREVTHIQFVSWPDHGIPEEAHLLLKLRRRVNAFKNFFSGPIIIHCSAGVGRTGTYIGIDAMMEGLEAEGTVDIYGYVVKLRTQRCLMVQVETQYILIHQALLEYNQFGETEITLPELHSTLSMLKQRNADNEPTLMEDEFERLPSFRHWRTFNTGMTEENQKKNRSSSVIPYDYNRVKLKLEEQRSRDGDAKKEGEEETSDEEDEESTKYINASHINGYWGPRTFIAAQTPLPDTMADFWSMVYQKRASAIVMLSDCNEEDQESDCIYWDEKKTFGDFEVVVLSADASPTFIKRNMLIRHVKRKESRPVTHFRFLKWANGELPEKPQDLADTIEAVKHSFGDSESQRSMSVVVHCNDGSSRSGLFCALWNVLESAETERLVDVFLVAKTLRKERQGMISSLEQYQFLYDALEGVYPVQNGEVKAVQASSADSVQIVNETRAAEQPASTTSSDQQGAAPPQADGGEEDPKEEPE